MFPTTTTTAGHYSIPELSGAWRGSVPSQGEGFVKVWAAIFTVRVRKEGLRRHGPS